MTTPTTIVTRPRESGMKHKMLVYMFSIMLRLIVIHYELCFLNWCNKNIFWVGWLTSIPHSFHIFWRLCPHIEFPQGPQFQNSACDRFSHTWRKWCPCLVFSIFSFMLEVDTFGIMLLIVFEICRDIILGSPSKSSHDVAKALNCWTCDFRHKMGRGWIVCFRKKTWV